MKNPQLRIKLGGKYNSSFEFNYTNEDNKIINEKIFDFGKSFNDGFAFVYKDNIWDIINSECNSVLKELKHSDIISLALKNVIPKDYFFIKNYAIGDNLVISVDFLRLKRTLEKLFPMETKDGYKLPPWRDNFHWNYSQQALFLINIAKDDLCFSFIEDLTFPGEGLIGIKPYNDFDGRWIYVTLEDFNNHCFNTPVIKCDFNQVYSFNEGLAKVEKNGMYGFIDRNGVTAIPISYDDARSFREGFAAVAIANCRPNSTKGKYISDFRWSFISINGREMVNSTHENLTSIRNGDYYFADSKDVLSKFNCACLDNEKMNEIRPFSKYGGISDVYCIQSHNVHWAKTEALGQLSPTYLIDLLTGQKSEKLGFKRWYTERIKAYYVIDKLFFNLPIDTLEVDFDTTQAEWDYIRGINSLEIKYGDYYLCGDWKSTPKKFTSRSDEWDNDELNKQGLREMNDDDPDWHWNID